MVDGSRQRLLLDEESGPCAGVCGRVRACAGVCGRVRARHASPLLGLILCHRGTGEALEFLVHRSKQASPMLKLVALISAKPDISREDFIAHYESSHAPMVKRLLPMIAEYRRSFVCREGDSAIAPPAPGFDVLTELWFEDQAALDAFWQRIQEPEVIAQIRADEAHFLTSERTELFQVEVYEGP